MTNLQKLIERLNKS